MRPMPLQIVRSPEERSTKVRVEGLEVSYPRDGKRVVILQGVNLEIAAGEIVCIVGPSGCGKSTLLNVMGGFLRPSGGRVTIDGAPVVGPDPRRIFVFQESSVFPWLTVEQNIGFGLAKLSSAERHERVAHYVEVVGLQGFERSYPHELSGGMRQRLEFARGLAVQPDVLFLDESFGALDSITRLKMRQELLRIHAVEPKTILCVTHDIDEAVQLSDRVVVMGARPARIRHIVDIDLPRPRDLSDRRYLALRDSILEEIGLAHAV